MCLPNQSNLCQRFQIVIVYEGKKESILLEFSSKWFRPENPWWFGNQKTQYFHVFIHDEISSKILRKHHLFCFRGLFGSVQLQVRIQKRSSSIAMENRIITKMPYKEKKSLDVMFCFMSRSALELLLNKTVWKYMHSIYLSMLMLSS